MVSLSQPASLPSPAPALALPVHTRRCSRFQGCPKPPAVPMEKNFLNGKWQSLLKKHHCLPFLTLPMLGTAS